LELRDHALQRIAFSCNRLAAISTGLCQPSEALDARWKRGWNRILPELQELKQALLALEVQKIGDE
jgi:hypothetical protein